MEIEDEDEDETETEIENEIKNEIEDNVGYGMVGIRACSDTFLTRHRY